MTYAPCPSCGNRIWKFATKCVHCSLDLWGPPVHFIVDRDPPEGESGVHRSPSGAGWLFNPWTGADIDVGEWFRLRDADLESEIASGARADDGVSEASEPDPNALSVDGNRITFRGETHVVDDDIAGFVGGLVRAGRGVWVSGSELSPLIQTRPDRTFKKLRNRLPELWAEIEPQTGAGYRLRPVV